MNKCLISSLALFLSLLNPAQAEETSSHPGTVHHLVLFRYKPETPNVIRQQIAQSFLALKEKCVRPGTSHPYIVSIDHGIFSSPEGADREIAANYPDAYIVNFESESDRDYYVGIPNRPFDPAHDSFKKHVGPHLDILRDANGKPVLDRQQKEQIKGVLVYDLTAK